MGDLKICFPLVEQARPDGRKELTKISQQEVFLIIADIFFKFRKRSLLSDDLRSKLIPPTGLLFFCKGELNSKDAAFIQLTFNFNFAFVKVDYFKNIAQTDTESFDIMHIAGGYAVEFFEDVLLIFFSNTYTVILNLNYCVTV